MNNTKITINKLQNEISNMIDNINWDIKTTHKDSAMNLIEVRALLIYAKNKLIKITKQEDIKS